MRKVPLVHHQSTKPTKGNRQRNSLSYLQNTPFWWTFFWSAATRRRFPKRCLGNALQKTAFL